MTNITWDAFAKNETGLVVLAVPDQPVLNDAKLA